MYVVKIDSETNQVVLGREDELLRDTFWASRMNFTSGETPHGPVEVNAKIRYKAKQEPATLVAKDGWAEIRFDSPQRAITPGQAVVFYQGEEVVGGGIIELERPRSEE